MTKYGTFVMYQNIETNEVVEIPLVDEEFLNKYANDTNWREVGAPEGDDAENEEEK